MQYAFFADAPRQRTAEQERHTTVVNKLTSLEGEMREGFRAHLERIRGVEARVALLESSVPRYNTPSGGFPSPSRANGGQLESHVERAITLHDIKEDAATPEKDQRRIQQDCSGCAYRSIGGLRDVRCGRTGAPSLRRNAYRTHHATCS